MAADLKTIAFIELECHAEVLRPLLQLMAVVEGYQFRLYIRQQIWEETGLQAADHPQIELTLISNSDSTADFLKRYHPALNQLDGLFFLTLQQDFHHFNHYVWRPKIIIRVHNTRYYFAPEKMPWYKTPNWRLSIKQLIYGEAANKQKFLARADHFVFINDDLQQWALQHTSVPAHKVLPSFAAAFFTEKEFQKDPTDTFQVVVPGALDQNRRDYHLLTEALQLFKRNATGKVRVEFLGSSAGASANEVRLGLQQLHAPDFEIVLHPGFVSPETFESGLQLAAVLLAPIQLQTYFHVFAETYGQSKLSASVHEGLLHGLKVVLPASYQAVSGLENLIVSYRDAEHLAACLLKLQQQPDSRTVEPAEHSIYRFEVQVGRLREVLLAIG